MEKSLINQKVRKTLMFLIIVSVACVAAVPAMISALVAGNWFLAAPCIALVACGFYGLPFGWVYFGMLKEQQGVVNTIIEDEIHSIEELAQTLGKRPKRLTRIVRNVIAKRYLTGVKITSDGKLVASKQPKPVKGKCPYCSAPLSVGAKMCAHCGSAV